MSSGLWASKPRLFSLMDTGIQGGHEGTDRSTSASSRMVMAASEAVVDV